MTSPVALELPEVLLSKVEAGNDNSIGEVDIFLGYQKTLLDTTSHYALVVCEKSRRIGMTWAVGADAVLTSSTTRKDGGMDTLYIGYNLDMAREFIDVCAMWARAFNHVVTNIEETVFVDKDKDGDKEIKAFRITFASGFEIMALTSNPRSLRGRQGYLIFDEAAFHDDLKGMMKAAMAFLIWGGRVLVISTHEGEDNEFNKLVEEVRSGKRNGKVLRVDFDQAVADGLYERRCLTKGETPTPEGKQAWVDEIRGYYGDDAEEELDCIPAKGGGAYLNLASLEACADRDIPVIRYDQPDSFKLVAKHLREAEVKNWCEETLLPLLEKLNIQRRHAFGQDFGRLSDLSVLWPLEIMENGVAATPFTLELRNIPFEQQKQIVFYIIDRLPRFSKAAFDAGGNGAYLAEVAQQEYGENRVEEVKFSQEWYRENMPVFKAAIEDRDLIIPKDDDTIVDFRQIRTIDGVAKVHATRTNEKGGKGKKRHGDAAIAAVLAHWASRLAPISYGYTPVKRETKSLAGEAKMSMKPDHSGDMKINSKWNEGAF